MIRQITEQNDAIAHQRPNPTRPAGGAIWQTLFDWEGDLERLDSRYPQAITGIRSLGMRSAPQPYVVTGNVGISQAQTQPQFVFWVDQLIAWMKTIATAAVYTTLVVTFGFQIARVDGQSMAPTLHSSDRLVVNKLAYLVGSPTKGDIVMFYYPLDPADAFVKRVIAEEGDTVRIAGGRVYVNDRPVDDSYVPNEYRSYENFGPQVVQSGYYFVLGDHRNDSSDSREWGLVPKKYITGKVQARWWPLQNARAF